jgi:hypothetical protein
MTNLILKVKNYQEDKTFINIKLNDNLDKDEVIKIGKQFKNLVDSYTNHSESTPNVVRFENEKGIFNSNLYPIVEFI